MFLIPSRYRCSYNNYIKQPITVISRPQHNTPKMMDFEDAAVRLARDQLKLRGRHKGGSGIAISAKARQQAEYHKKQQARLRAERERKKRDEAYIRQYLHECQRSLKEKSLAENSSPLFLKPTSIHGDGDKIALPSSVLETLTSQSFSSDEDTGGNPWTFRIGIVNPKYEFPASPLFKVLQAPTNNDDDDDMSIDDDEENRQDEQKSALYLDELGHKYLAYTHCTVVEFTQEEGHVGIPRHIAQSLLDPNNRHSANRNGVDIAKTRTIDPAASSIEENDETDDIMTEQTPGHLAWGAFEIPDIQLEIIMVKLPKGTGCTLQPTEEAIKNNFYGLKDVKLVLEQSLIRTRATLSIGDKVSTWFRGTKFDLNVTKILPSTFQAVTCINTDIEVEIGETTTKEDNAPAEPSNIQKTSTKTTTTTTSDNNGFRLGSGQSTTHSSQVQGVALSHGGEATASLISLLPEPPVDQKAGVCTVQIRYSGGNGKRRFAIETAQAKDLFAFAASLIHQNERSFRLVTRFPRRELSLVDADQIDDSGSSNSQLKVQADLTLNQAGLQPGQEMFIIEGL